ncbi:MarR family transcriptional regulator [Plantibacter sp. PA-3-X8]|uniref:MarR family winged helix-turn-helix transcriptional regulator n=1 Tax=Plantibacter sp. PA-3-X8 TaxID=2480625 RepID=UPI000F5D5C9C|nr:MarR family transcriptional regulator [Plantibacter sp. PA-3-X8]AZH82003.1 MarR family transcriptional regulator [Plantibacter sp. PA-3-X8]
MDPRTADMAAAVLAAFDVTARTTEAVTPALDELDLTMNTAYALWMVDPDAESLAMKELAARMHCTPPNATFLYGQLEQRGLVERLPHPSDRRQRMVSLSERGRAVRASMIDVVLLHGPLNGLTRRELAVVGRLLEKAARSRP